MWMPTRSARQDLVFTTEARLGVRNSGWIAVLLVSLPAISLAQQIAIEEYPLPTSNISPCCITVGPDGGLWFTEAENAFGGSNNIGRITTAGVITEYPVPTFNSSPGGITAGPDGALWFTEYNGNNIGRITTAGVVTEYPAPKLNSGLDGITAGPDGALWFTEYQFYASRIGRITTAGVITEYSLPTAGSGPLGITAGPDGALLFTEYFANQVGRISTTGVATEYPVPVSATPSGITAGPDGALWFNDSDGRYIGRITTTGVITMYPVTTANSFQGGITAGPDGALWFTESSYMGISYIGRITTTGVITEYPVPTANSIPGGITAGPDGALWFTDSYGKIGEAVFVSAGLSVSPTSGSCRTNLTFSGSAFGANEKVKIYVSGVGSVVLTSATANASGSFTAAAREPQASYGPRIFLGKGQRTGKLGAAGFSVTARLIMNPSSGTVGSSAAAQGFGFGAGETVTIYWDNPRTLLGTTTANVQGTFQGGGALTFTIPKGAPAGVNKIFGTGQTTGAVGAGSFTVR